MLGNSVQEERGDIVFRRLKPSFLGISNDHPAILNYWLDSQTSAPGNLLSTMKHVVEMTGFTGTASDISCLSSIVPYVVTSTQGVSDISLSDFQSDSPVYYGSYTHLLGPIQRGANGQWGTRSGIIQTAQALLLRSEFINYAVVPGECVGLVANRYMSASGSGATVGVNDVSSLRSDAFAEFPYAANGWPNLTRSGTLISIADRFSMSYVDQHALHYNPQFMRSRLIESIIDIPSVILLAGPSGDTPILNGATSSTTIRVKVEDKYSGPLRLEIQGSSFESVNLNFSAGQVGDTTSYIFTSGDLAGLTNMQNGEYSVRVVDQGGNAQTTNFAIDSGPPGGGIQDCDGVDLGTGPVNPNKCVVFRGTNTLSGVAQMDISGSGIPSTSIKFPCSKKALLGPYAELAAGTTYALTVHSCSGVSSATTIAVSTEPLRMTLTAVFSDGSSQTDSTSISYSQVRNNSLTFKALAEGCCAFNPWTCCPAMTTTADGASLACAFETCSGGGTAMPLSTLTVGPPAQSMSWTVTNSGANRSILALHVRALVPGVSTITVTKGALDSGEIVTGTIAIPEVPELQHNCLSSLACIDTPIHDVQVASDTIASDAELAAREEVLARISSVYQLGDAGVVYTTTATLTVTYEPVAGVAIDTTTLRIYRFDGEGWEKDSIFDQTVSIDTMGVISVVGLSTQSSSIYAAFFDLVDSSRPVTTLFMQGSTSIFNGAVLVSTDAFVVLTATDPAVNGFASQVKTISYRFDQDSVFTTYTSSIPLPLGTHVLEYRSVDYAGNFESVQSATFTVTPGTVLRETSTAMLPGTLLNGYLGSGAKLEVESQAQNSLTLMISSVNRQAMVSVDNIGEVGIGVTPQANLNIGQDSIALQLRSGNSTSAVTSNQIALAYNGDNSMRHLLRTEHSTAAHSNKMNFLVWNTGAGSTTTLASLNVLSLQGIATASGGSFHVQLVGEPDAEVEVSNGLSTGGGTMQRLQVVSPSSRRFKTNIKNLSERDENRALEDVAALKHARFRYKSRQKDGRLLEDPAQPLRTGLIYEEAPESIREGKESLSTTERLVNVELALKASMRRLEELQKRYEKLKARRTTP